MLKRRIKRISTLSPGSVVGGLQEKKREGTSLESVQREEMSVGEKIPRELQVL